MDDTLKCIGCGAPLQSEDKSAPGYVPEHNLFREDVICQRCFRLKNYNEIQDVGMDSEDFLNLLNELSDRKGIIVNVVDIFDFEGSFINALKRIVGNKKIILAPGIIQSHQMTHYVSEKELKTIVPKNEIKQRVFQLNEGQTLFFGGLSRIDYVSGGKRPLVCYFSNDLNIHRTKTEKANDLWRNQIGNVLTPPNNPDHFDMSDTKAVRLETGKEKKDIMISGLGFITIEAGAKVIVRVPKNVDVILRNSIM